MSEVHLHGDVQILNVAFSKQSALDAVRKAVALGVLILHTHSRDVQ